MNRFYGRYKYKHICENRDEFMRRYLCLNKIIITSASDAKKVFNNFSKKLKDRKIWKEYYRHSNKPFDEFLLFGWLGSDYFKFNIYGKVHISDDKQVLRVIKNIANNQKENIKFQKTL